MIPVLLGLGSNTSFSGFSSIELLAKACQKLCGILKNPVMSSVYESKAMYVTDQNNFYNMVFKGFADNSMSPFELLKQINQIEAELGRDRSKEIRFGPRSMDIDIEEFGTELINTPDLEIPHPRMKEREFVLIPALEILKESADSKLRETLNSYLKSLSPQGVEKCPENTQILFRKLLEGGCYGNKTC